MTVSFRRVVPRRHSLHAFVRRSTFQRDERLGNFDDDHGLQIHRFGKRLRRMQRVSRLPFLLFYSTVFFFSLIRKILKREPADRLKIAQILKHDWLKDLGGKKFIHFATFLTLAGKVTNKLST